MDDSIALRLKKARKELGLSQKEMAKETGGALVTAISKYEQGIVKPSADMLAKLGDLGININWLLTGCGSMFTYKEQMLRETSQAVTNESLTNKGMSLLPCGLYSAANCVYVPLSNMEACCGDGITFYEGNYELNESIPVKMQHIGSLVREMPPFAIQTHGRSMEGYGIREGSIVVVNPAERPAPGNVVMVSINEKLAIKKYYERENGIELMSATGDKIYISNEEQREGYYIHIFGRIMLVVGPPEDGV